MNQTLSVTSLNTQIKSLLEATFVHASVEGEVSRFTYHGSGHLYFTLKDANSAISCVMFKGNNSRMKFRLEEGMKVIISGSISLYVPRGSYQLNCVSIEPAGSGALAMAYEQLKEKLKNLGYFESERKKEIPRYIKSMALVTSATGAALQDMLRVAKNRWPLVKITIIDTIVQGENSAKNIAKNIKLADLLEVDVIVTGRGGGSIEDLWGFNEEIVADAIFRASTPIVSAVGHEIDYVISDFVSDLRAPTPSAAMEMILPDKNELLMSIDDMIEQMSYSFRRAVEQKSIQLQSLRDEFQRYSFEQKSYLISKEITILKERFNTQFDQILQKKVINIDSIKDNLSFMHKQNIIKKEQLLQNLNSLLNSKNPTLGLNENYAQVVKNGKTIKPENLLINDIYELQTKNKTVKSKVLDIEINQ
ncbi:MAG: exodeoxyribonuclease VII large subunit [Epsilonproteobacteria bacterium]|nr:exodeoxyribonuclease VII large subunit [Campylobacterota bacterium]